MHLDEASPHLHIDFIPFYTKERQRGLKKGVSMRAALIEQGFVPENNGKNQLTLWEKSERKEMEYILHRRGFLREDKHADYAHMSVGEYKALQDSRRMEALLRQRQTISKGEATRMEVYRLKEELQSAQQTVRQLEAQKDSPYVKFFYATDDKQAYVMQQLEEMGIPFRETENGFEAQECHIKTIRGIEKNYHGQPVSYREQLKEDIDRCMLGAKDFRDFLQKLANKGYSIRTGKYIAAKPWGAERYIRLKSLGEYYSEAALQNRLRALHEYEKQLAEKIEDAKIKKAPNVMVLLTEQEKTAERAIEHMIYMGERDTKKLTEARAHHDEIKAAQKDAAEKLEMIEKIKNGTYIQDMLDKFGERKRSEVVPNGYYNANTGVRR